MQWLLGSATVPVAVFGVPPKTLRARRCSAISQHRMRRRLAGETPTRGTGTVPLPKLLRVQVVMQNKGLLCWHQKHILFVVILPA
jgi:hypothetical protein